MRLAAALLPLAGSAFGRLLASDYRKHKRIGQWVAASNAEISHAPTPTTNDSAAFSAGKPS